MGSASAISSRGCNVSLIDEVMDELAAVHGNNPSERRVQASTMIRFGGGLHLIRRHIVIEAVFSRISAAKWLESTIEHDYMHDTELLEVKRSTAQGQSSVKYAVRVIRQGGPLALQTGLLDERRHPVRGLPAHVLRGNKAENIAALRGAFLAHGELSDPGRSSYLRILCPGYEAAAQLVGLAKSISLHPTLKLYRNTERFELKDADAIERLLLLMGAHRTSREWSGKRSDGLRRGEANRLANFDDANMRRSAKAAVEASAKVRHAFSVLGDDVPEKLRKAGQLRLDHKDASLDELGRLSDPPITKDAIAGRIRRLFQLSQKVERDRERMKQEETDTAHSDQVKLNADVDQ